MRKKELEIVVYQEDDGFVAQCLNVNVASDGDTAEEAMANIKEALELYFDEEPSLSYSPVHKARLSRLTLQSA
jgi:predicted RNase H-like HicB family nuclease